MTRIWLIARRAALTLLLSMAFLWGIAAQGLAVTSAVGLHQGQPRLFIDNRPLESGFLQIYQYPGVRGPMPGQPEYADPQWLEAMQRTVDLARSQGVGLLMASAWWSDLDRSPRRPTSPEMAVYDFAKMDDFMAYAARRGVHVILKVAINRFLPDWWRAEHGLAGSPSTCTVCETDALGTVYDNPSMGSPSVRQDFGLFVSSVVARYRGHPALAGWAFGLGPTGEDAYGPSYIQVDAPGGGQGLGRRPLMFTDYSPDFAARFRDWLIVRYGSEAALRQAWQDPAVSFLSFRMPPPAELLRNPDAFGMAPFPDPVMDMPVELPAVLTQKGQDFYAFRVQAREEDTDYLARLIKSQDPHHVLLINARVRATAVNHPAIDGVFFNPHPRFGQPLFKEFNQLNTILESVEAIAAAGKLPMVASENAPSRAAVDGRFESEAQLNYLLALGCSVKALGGMMGYTVDLLDPKTDSRWLPSWFSREALATMRSIEACRPAPERGPCDYIRTLRRNNQCEAGQANPQGCELTNLAAINYCKTDMRCDANGDGRVSDGEYARCRQPASFTPPMGNSPVGASPMGAPPAASRQGAPPPGAPGAGGNKCGDGVCDEVERSRNVCPQDCRNGAATSAAPAAPPAASAPTPGAPTSGTPMPGAPGGMQHGKCGDGICDEVERSRGVCAQDCTPGAISGTTSGAPPATSSAPASTVPGASKPGAQP